MAEPKRETCKWAKGMLELVSSGTIQSSPDTSYCEHLYRPSFIVSDANCADCPLHEPKEAGDDVS